MTHKLATDHDKKIIDAVSVALDGKVGRKDDVDRLMQKVQNHEGSDDLRTACEIAIAFARWSQDMKGSVDRWMMEVQMIRCQHMAGPCWCGRHGFNTVNYPPSRGQTDIDIQ